MGNSNAGRRTDPLRKVGVVCSPTKLWWDSLASFYFPSITPLFFTETEALDEPEYVSSYLTS